uniref:J domain-containing protein n=1 Tax=Leersia perrieri TaxID=77586 RepID=A0A0D9VT50_9ORYZ
MAVSSPTSAPEKKRKWLLSNRKVIDKYLREARTILAAAPESGGGDAVAALGFVDLALELSPRMESALELRGRALLALRRYRDVAEMLRDYIPSCAKTCSGDDTLSSTSSSLLSSGSGDLGTISRAKLLSPDRHRSDATAEPGASAAARSFRCFDISELKRRVLASLSKNPNTDTQWRYLVLGQACFHLGLIEDAMVLLQTGRRLASAAFRRESVSLSEDSFSSSSPAAAVAPIPSGNTTKSGSAFIIPAMESEAVSNLLAHVKLLLRRRTAAMAALDAGLPAEAVRHFSKILEARRGVLPHPFAAACLVGRAAAFRAGGRPADAIADCNRALALDPAYIPALRARADLLQSVGALADCLRDLDHLKLLYDAALRDGKLPGPRWRPQGGVRYREIAGAHRKLTTRIQELRRRVGAGEACNIDYYALLGIRRGCTRSELERAHLLLTLKLKPDRAVVFGERLELIDEHRDLEAVRDQARMSALLLYRMLQKGYSFIMSAVIDEEAAERQRAREAAAAAKEAAAAAAAAKEAAAAAAAAEAAAAALAAKQEAAKQEQAAPPMTRQTENAPIAKRCTVSKPKPKGKPAATVPTAMSKKAGRLATKTTAAATSKAAVTAVAAPKAALASTAVTAVAATESSSTAPVYQGVFCRDMAVVGTLLSRGGFDRTLPVKCEAMSC